MRPHLTELLAALLVSLAAVPTTAQPLTNRLRYVLRSPQRVSVSDRAGGRTFDGYITDERDMNRDWNTVWDGRTTRFDEGWTVEMAIPFKSLRFRDGRDQIWGVNFKRVVRWKNEMQYLTRIPAALGRRGINKLSSAATLVGIEPPQSGRNFEVKPYGIGVSRAQKSRNRGQGDAPLPVLESDSRAATWRL